MIEIQTYPDETNIYLDFAYHGLPEDLPIEKIVIRGPPEKILGEPAEPGEPGELGEPGEPGELGEPISSKISLQEIKTQVKEMLLEADQIQFGEELEAITQVIEVPEAEQRFGIDKQVNDLLDDLLSEIPNAKRTKTVLNNIHTMIQRFQQLRTLYSKFDEQGHAMKPKTLGANYKPLVHSLKKLNKELYWLLPVVKNKKKVL